ncbi:MAG: hypothetical protein N2114_06655, partial [Candidatus Goldbacteria bacterium]|nr:hypothetical protein [Candidatus Goldiibacteriota bacterium]
VSREEALKRLSVREKKDRIEQESSAFHNKIRRGYLKEGKLINAVIIKTDGKSASEVFDITKKVLFRVIKWQ